MEFKFALQPKQKVLASTIESTPITFFGGAKGGGKSKGIQLVNLIRRLTQPKTHSAIFRRTYPELRGNHIRPLLESYPVLRNFYNDTKKILSLPNGSTTEFCYCKNESDVWNYQGREFYDLFVDEVGQWSESMFKTLLGSNRSTLPGVKPRAILTGNPGGIGHAWLKRIFIDRNFKPEERPNDYAFIPALVGDNAALMENDPDYVYRLQSEPNEILRRAYLYGDWDIMAGQFFSVSRETHIVDPFEIPEHWAIGASYDFGFNHPAAFLLFAISDEQVIYVIHEWVIAKTHVDDFAKLVNQHPLITKAYPIMAGKDCFAQKQLTASAPASIAEIFKTHGIYLKPANTDRIQSANIIRSYLNAGKLKFFSTCMNTFNCVARMQHDPNRPEDVLKVDSDNSDPATGDDAYDALRYFMMTRPEHVDAPKPSAPAPGTPEFSMWQLEKFAKSEAKMLDAYERELESNLKKAWWEK